MARLFSRLVAVAILVAFHFLFSTHSLQAAGMYPPNMLPLKELKDKLGFEPSDDWIKNIFRSSVRFPNGSGSFISSTGLVLTNHHVALSALQNLSSEERDIVKNGYLAHSNAEELQAPNMELNVLTDIIDVSDRVNAAVKPEMTPGEAAKAREHEALKIEDESFQKSGNRSDVITFYDGLKYQLYIYKRYTDVRLVFAPEKALGFFGGDTDNFEFPRHALDMTIFRVYENGKPIKADHYLTWSQKGAEEGEYVFTSGHPGSTNRMMLSPSVEYSRNIGIPFSIEVLENRRSALIEYSKRGDEQKRQATSEIFGLENSLKVFRSRKEFLQTEDFINLKKAQERELIAKDQANGNKYEIEKQIKGLSDLLGLYVKDMERIGLVGNLAFNAKYMTHAQDLVRMALQGKKPNHEREKRYTDNARATLLIALQSSAPIYPEMEIAKLTESLGFLVKRLGADSAEAKIILEGKSPEEVAAKLVGGTKLGDPAFRMELMNGGIEAIKNSSDPFIQLSLRIEDLTRQVAEEQREKYQGPTADFQRKIAAARLEYLGKSYPDATFTLRLSYGQIAGYPQGEDSITPFTTLSGLFLKSEARADHEDYQLPQRWKDARGRLALRTPFDFVSKNDIIGGNSGSPVINTNGELIGLAFDGNRYATGDVFYREPVGAARTISVDCRVMLEALEKVYKAGRVVKELTIK